jgi:hypothetical protein
MKELMFFLVVSLFILSACAIKGGDPTVAVSPTERFVQADGNFKALVATVREYVVKGYIIKDSPTAKKLDGALTSVKVAIDVWELNPTNLDAETATLVALQGLQALLNTVKPSTEATYDGGLLWAA